MKRLICMIMALVLSLTACGGAPASPSGSTGGGSEATVTTAGKKPRPDKGGKITLEKLMEAEDSPEDDFVVIDHDNGHVELLQYIGSSEVVVIPQTWKGKEITSIASYVFGVNSNVKAIRLSDSIECLDLCSFSTNENLEIIVCGSGLKTLEDAVFLDSENLHTVILNDGVETISTLVFGDCKSLTEIEIPSSVTNIEPGAFSGCPDNFLIIGEAGSAAEQYAADEGFQFQAK